MRVMHRGPVNSPHKWPVTRKLFPFDEVIMSNFSRDSLKVQSYAFHLTYAAMINTLRPRQNGRHFADDIFKCIFLNQNAWISLTISLKFVPKVRINNIPALVQIMAWRRPGDKPISKPTMVSSLTHICVTWHQWAKTVRKRSPQTNKQ